MFEFLKCCLMRGMPGPAALGIIFLDIVFFMHWFRFSCALYWLGLPSEVGADFCRSYNACVGRMSKFCVEFSDYWMWPWGHRNKKNKGFFVVYSSQKKGCVSCGVEHVLCLLKWSSTLPTSQVLATFASVWGLWRMYIHLAYSDLIMMRHCYDSSSHDARNRWRLHGP